jgi:hypothetical protein
MVVPLLTALRTAVLIMLLPFRIVLGFVGGLAALAGGLGVIAWTIQLLIGGTGGGPLPPGVMWLACLGAALAGLVMLTLSGPRATDQPAAAPMAPELTDQDDLPCNPDTPVVDTEMGLRIRPIRADDLADYLRALN